MADKSGLSPQERHQIIIDKLKEFKKKEKVFHMRWTPGDLLDGKVLKATPAFWYMRYGWSRQEIESVFYDARVYIDPVYENALDAVFGTDGKGPRWLPPEMQEEQRGKWNRRGYYKTQPWWKVKELGNVPSKGQSKTNYKDEPYSYETEWRMKNRKNEANNESNQKLRRRSLLNSNLSASAETIWQKMSNYGGKNDKIDYKKFKEALKERNINIPDDVAKKLFELYADKDGFMDFKTLQELLRKLDQTQIQAGIDIGPIDLSDLDDPLKAQILMKRVLLAAAMDMPFDAMDFVNAGKITGNVAGINIFGSRMAPSEILALLADRDGDPNKRVGVMENIANNLGTNPEYDVLFDPQNASDLMMGWTAQMLDNTHPQASKLAIDQVPTIFREIEKNSHPDVAMGHLDDVLDGLFNVLDNKKHEKNQDAAKKALKDIVDDVVMNQDAEAVLYLSGLLGEKTDIENCTDPNARATALDLLKRVMMGDNSNKMDPNNMPTDPAPQKEWLDVGTNNKTGPSDKLMDQGSDDPNNKNNLPTDITEKDLIEDYNQRGKKKPQTQQTKNAGNNGKYPDWGGDNETNGNDDNGQSYNDNDPNTEYGGGDAPDRTESEFGDDPNKPKRKKGKQNDISLKFGKNPNNNNDPNNNGDDDLDDNGNPNDPGDNGGKRGGTKRQGTNGKGDFGGKFGDNSNQGSNPYGKGNIGSGGDKDPKNKNNASPDDDEKNPLSQAPMTSNDIGDEFRDVVSDAVSHALMDPNKKNKDNAGKLVDVMNDLAPDNFSDNLDGHAKNKYLSWKKGPLKNYNKPMPNPQKQLPKLNATTQQHHISHDAQVTIKPPTMPDI